MNKKLFLCILLLFLLFTLTGCKRNYTCVKKGIERENKSTGDKFTADSSYSIKLNSKKKAIKYVDKTIYTYESEDVCNKKCESAEARTQVIMKKNYSGYNSTVKCDCKKKKYSITNEYTISELDKVLRVEIRYLNKDNTFKLAEWLENNKGNGYDCK